MPSVGPFTRFQDDEPARHWTSVEENLQAQFSEDYNDFVGDTALQVYTPELRANPDNFPNLGADGFGIGRFVELPGNFVQGWTAFRFAGTGVSAGTGTYSFTLPTAVDEAYHRVGTNHGTGDPLGSCRLHDNSSSGTSQNSVLYIESSNAVRISLRVGANTRAMNHQTPFVVANLDSITGTFIYKQGV